MVSTLATGNTWAKEIGNDGAFVRNPTSFHGRVSKDPNALHAAESGRYHLFVSLACPWAHRTLIVRALIKKVSGTIFVIKKVSGTIFRDSARCRESAGIGHGRRSGTAPRGRNPTDRRPIRHQTATKPPPPTRQTGPEGCLNFLYAKPRSTAGSPR